MLPILHLNGYKIANPTVLGPHRTTRSWTTCSRGYGYEPHFVEGDEPAAMHQEMAATLDDVLDEIATIQTRRVAARPRGGRAGR